MIESLSAYKLFGVTYHIEQLLVLVAARMNVAYTTKWYCKQLGAVTPGLILPALGSGIQVADSFQASKRKFPSPYATPTDTS